jgi:hypothetical protein
LVGELGNLLDDWRIGCQVLESLFDTESPVQMRALQ